MGQPTAPLRPVPLETSAGFRWRSAAIAFTENKPRNGRNNRLIITNFDFQQFAHQLAQATQAAFTELLAQHPTKEFYSFALYRDEGAMTVCPAANTLAHLAAQPPDNLPYAKFEPAE